MYIKSITLEGFKSYGQRTHIDGYDPYFNAITGLNGSGKSNILDGICFLLGITTLSQVRVSNLQELVYKNGQAGIAKASVSITFDNTNKKQCPLGYDQYNEITVTRQVVIGGRNKYMINGCNAQSNRVQDLFRSVQMNVNNPHFLIMQGRITKVLNMKPPEILSMIEEAAGTKMYESKKQAAMRTIEKKDAKLNEIDSILAEDITPTLTKLKDERAAFLEFQKIQRELEHSTKLCVAYQYVSEEEASKRAKEDLVKLTDAIDKVQRKMVQMQTEMKAVEAAIAKLIEKRTAESGDMLKGLDSAFTSKQKEEAKISSNMESKMDSLEGERKKRANLEKQHEEDSVSVQSKDREVEKLLATLQAVLEECSKDAEALTMARNHFQAISSGLSSNTDGQEATLAEQLMKAKNDIADAETESKQAEMTLKHAEPELKRKSEELKRTEKEYEKDRAALQPLQDALAHAEAELRKLRYQEGSHEQSIDARRAIQRDVGRLQEKLDTMEYRQPQMSFEYSDPQPNFDRRKVLGLVCKLFTVKDPKFATALEVAAGGKLFNVVVDNEVTGKLLLERGRLKRRHTIIPMNKIQGTTIRPDVLATARRLVGDDNVCTALSLVEYDRSLQPVMEYVFGSVLVCPDMNTAKAVSMHDAIRRRTVTLDGEDFNPVGTLSGGSRKPGAPLLSQLAELESLRRELDEKKEELKKVDKDLVNTEAQAKRFRELKEQFELRQHEYNLVQQRLQHTVHHQKMEELERLRRTIEEQNELLTKCKEVKRTAEEKVVEVEDKLKNAEEYRRRELEAAEKKVTECQKKAEASNKLMKEKQQEVDSLKLEAEDFKKGLSNYEEQIKAVDAAIAGYERQISELGETLNQAKAEVAMAKEALTRQKELLKSTDKDISELQRKQDVLQKDTNEGKLKIKELQIDVNQLQTTSKEGAQRLQHLLSHYEWIAEEKQYFGQPNTAYDFRANNPEQAKRRLHKLQEDKDRLSKKVNMRAMTMLGKTEEQYNDLMKKKKIVENDKAKIEAVIHELDEKKKEALVTAWQQVNEDFGSIFVSLLPGTQAKLMPPDGKTVMDGLEFKVAFGNKWKESLNELSGGQRSLVALSLILAMLRFRPAPIYILDEVDAALDLSHTQNIGMMLRTHFKHSQFIIVSLKDGMFNNANVLFKTKFVDGMSTVTRHTPTRQTPRH